MDAEQFARLRESTTTTVTIENVTDWTARTLLLGETSTGFEFHVYIEGGLIWRYDASAPAGAEREVKVVWDAYELFPDGRVYPERTDFQFAELLRRMQVYPTYTVFDEDAHAATVGREFFGTL